jgi:hypothetical protein
VVGRGVAVALVAVPVAAASKLEFVKDELAVLLLLVESWWDDILVLTTAVVLLTPPDAFRFEFDKERPMTRVLEGGSEPFSDDEVMIEEPSSEVTVVAAVVVLPLHGDELVVEDEEVEVELHALLLLLLLLLLLHCEF